MEAAIEGMTALMIVIGAVFLFVGSFELAKLPDTMRRLHGPTKSTTLGVGAMLIASMIYFSFVRDTTGIHEVLISLFLFLTAPVSAHMIAKAHIFADKELQEALPPPDKCTGWATLKKNSD